MSQYGEGGRKGGNKLKIYQFKAAWEGHNLSMSCKQTMASVEGSHNRSHGQCWAFGVCGFSVNVEKCFQAKVTIINFFCR